jgi:hypothetical protein
MYIYAVRKPRYGMDFLIHRRLFATMCISLLYIHHLTPQTAMGDFRHPTIVSYIFSGAWVNLNFDIPSEKQQSEGSG